MLLLEATRHQVALAGLVTDGQTSQAISGAQVEIIGAPEAFTSWLALKAKQYGARWAALVERPDRTRTAADGHFHFLDLPDGDYTLAASLPSSGTRYGPAQLKVSVSRDTDGNVTLVGADMKLPPTTLRGQITAQGGDPVLLAQVRIEGSGERTFSDSQGEYRLTGLETGQRTVRVSARGYQSDSQDVVLDQPGTEQTLNFALITLP